MCTYQQHSLSRTRRHRNSCSATSPTFSCEKNVFIALFPRKHFPNAHLSLESKSIQALHWRGAQCELVQRGVVMLPCQRLHVSPQRLILSPEVQSEKSSTD